MTYAMPRFLADSRIAISTAAVIEIPDALASLTNSFRANGERRKAYSSRPLAAGTFAGPLRSQHDLIRHGLGFLVQKHHGQRSEVGRIVNEFANTPIAVAESHAMSAGFADGCEENFAQQAIVLLHQINGDAHYAAPIKCYTKYNTPVKWPNQRLNSAVA